MDWLQTKLSAEYEQMKNECVEISDKNTELTEESHKLKQENTIAQEKIAKLEAKLQKTATPLKLLLMGFGCFCLGVLLLFGCCHYMELDFNKKLDRLSNATQAVSINSPRIEIDPVHGPQLKLTLKIEGQEITSLLKDLDLEHVEEEDITNNDFEEKQKFLHQHREKQTKLTEEIDRQRKEAFMNMKKRKQRSHATGEKVGSKKHNDHKQNSTRKTKSGRSANRSIDIIIEEMKEFPMEQARLYEQYEKLLEKTKDFQDFLTTCHEEINNNPGDVDTLLKIRGNLGIEEFENLNLEDFDEEALWDPSFKYMFPVHYLLSEWVAENYTSYLEKFRDLHREALDQLDEKFNPIIIKLQGMQRNVFDDLQDIFNHVLEGTSLTKLLKERFPLNTK